MSTVRKFLEPAKGSDSYIKIVDDDDNYISIKIADCNRAITLEFFEYGKKEKKYAKKKFLRLFNALKQLGERKGWLDADRGREVLGFNGGSRDNSVL